MTPEIKAHLELNASTESYRHLPGNYECRDGRWGHYVDWEKVGQRFIEMAEHNLKILAERMADFDKKEGPRVGDYLELPYGMVTRFTYDWGEEIQIGGGSHSFYLGTGGYTSYSGSLDPGIKKEYMVDAGYKKDGLVWFFHEGYSGGGRGVYFSVPFRVFKLVENYDTSTIWMVQNKERQMYREKAETITRINGNGQPYTLPIPEINLIGVTHEQVLKIESESGLKFEKGPWNNYRCQPLFKHELTAVDNAFKWEKTYYNNGTTENSIYYKLGTKTTTTPWNKL